MCYYCHVLKNNPRAPIHQSVRCLDCANTYSQVPMIQRTHNHGQLLSLTPSAPPAEEELVNKPNPKNESLVGWFKNRLK